MPPALPDVHPISRMRFKRIDATPDDPKVDPDYQTLIHVGPGAYRHDQLFRYFHFAWNVWRGEIKWSQELEFWLPWHDPSKTDGSLLTCKGWVGQDPKAYPPYVTGKTSTKDWDACGIGYVAQLGWPDLTNDQQFDHSYLWDFEYDHKELRIGISKWNSKNLEIPGWTFPVQPYERAKEEILSRWNLHYLEMTNRRLAKEAAQ